MANPETFITLDSLFFFLLVLLQPQVSNQLEPSQLQAIVRIKQQLNYPEELTRWSENQDSCNSEPTSILTLACYEDNLTQLHVTGNNNNNTPWFPYFNQGFSVSALFANIAAFPSLKVLSLTSLGLEGPLPHEIGALSALEILNLSSNSFTGPIPGGILFMKNLQTLILDFNGFNGNIPDWIGSFQELRVLSLRNNFFAASFPAALSGLVSLRALSLSGNRLSGQVPGLHRLSNLQVLDLGDNNLGPKFPSLPTRLVSLSLKKNKFHSAVGDELGSCYQLQSLDMSSNQLVGQFLTSILTLPSLIYLDISGNKFTGRLSHNLSCNAMLKFVNLSENRLTGDLPECLRSGSRNRTVLYDGNCLSGRALHQHPLPFCHNEALAVGISPHGQRERRPRSKGVIASGIAGGIAILGLLGIVFLFVKTELGYRNRNRNGNEASRTRLVVDKVSPAYTLQLLKDARYISETKKLGTLGIPPYRTFVLDELKEATSNFATSNLIGEGSSGQVYKGWLTNGTIVAIRSLKVQRKHGMHSFTPQLELIAKLRHCHLVSAIGHCVEFHQDDMGDSRIFLVFEYVANGTLRTHVSDGQSGQKFSWTRRIAAGIGVTRGIQFLHTGIVPGVYANRLKITDILLDHDYHVKISKYNLPLLTENQRLDEGEESKEHYGSTSTSWEKSDVYDVGAILLELIVGRAIISSNDINVCKDILTVSLAADVKARRSIVDPAVHKECSDDSVRTLAELCTRCLSKEPSERPSVEDVLWNLQYAAQVQDTWIRDGSARESPAHLPIEII